MPKKSTNQLIKDLAISVKKGVAESHTEIENLAQSVKRGFDEIHERFDGVDARFDAVDERLDKVENRLTKIENGHIGRIERLEDDMAHVKVKVGMR